MFNLLVHYSGWKEGEHELYLERLLEYTEPGVRERFSDRPQDLGAYPALFMFEDQSNREPARVGTLANVSLGQDTVSFTIRFDPTIPPISHSQIVTHADLFGIELAGWEMSRTHWAAKAKDLFRALYQLSIARLCDYDYFGIGEGIDPNPNLVSVMMPFAREFDNVFESIQNAVRDCGMQCQRADGIWDNYEVIRDIVQLIRNSQVVIVDSTGRNPNVLYELGLCHAYGKHTIQISQEGGGPFDVGHLRSPAYSNSPEGLATLETLIARRLQKLVAK